MANALVITVLLLIGMILGPPLVAGIAMLRRPYKNALVWYAGLLTLKPIFIALFWLCVSLAKIRIPDGIVTLLAPAVGITLLFSILCRKAFFNSETFPAARLLLAFDVVRWGIPLLGLILFSANWGEPVWPFPICCLGIFAAGLPTIFAYSALYLVNEYAVDSE